MTRVWIAADPAEAQLVAAALRANGIEAVVHAVPPGTASDRAQPHAVGPTVWVPDEHAERARALAHHIDPRRIASLPPRCEGCGEPG